MPHSSASHQNPLSPRSRGLALKVTAPATTVAKTARSMEVARAIACQVRLSTRYRNDSQARAKNTTVRLRKVTRASVLVNSPAATVKHSIPNRA